MNRAYLAIGYERDLVEYFYGNVEAILTPVSTRNWSGLLCFLVDIIPFYRFQSACFRVVFGFFRGDYIVKSWGEDYPNLALNEYYCMQIIKKANIEVPEFYLSDDYKLFIMKRFDLGADGTFLGFEDMCVLQAKQRDDKYDGSYEAIAKTIKIFTSAKHKKNALRQFFKMIVINNFVQNGDAHLKNYGLLYEGIHNVKLAPSYDVVSTTMYIKNDIPALHLLGSKKWWSRKFLIRFANETCDLSIKESNVLYDECLVALQDVIDEIKIKIKTENNEDVCEFLWELIEIFGIYIESP